MFKPDKCDLCGDCLTGCSYVDYSHQQAVVEFKALLAGKPAEILFSCVTCMACNEYCKNGAQPFDLITTLQETNRTLSVPEQTRAFFDQIEMIPTDQHWGTHKKKIVSLCTIEQFIPPVHLGHPMFDGLTVVKGRDYFCHLAKLHLAQPGAMEVAGRQFMAALRELSADEIIFFHDECYAMVHKMAHDYGEQISFKATHVLEHISDYLRRNPGKTPRQGLKIAFQRPCSSRLVPDAEKMIDQVFNLSGVIRVDRLYDRKNALCCGSALNGLGRLDAARKYQELNLLDAKNKGAEAVVYLCPMCGASLSQACQEHGLECLFIMDLCP